MKRPVGKTTLYYAGLLGALLIIASCDGDGGGKTTGAGHAPVISDLQLRALDPQVVGRDVRYSATFNAVDPGGDIIGGQCEVLLNGRSIGRVNIQAGPGVSENSTSGPVTCVFFVHAFIPIHLNGAVHIIDRSGDQSNDLGFTINIAELPRAEAPRPGGLPFTGTVESATFGR
jgi:hypothetical protein